MKNLTALIVAAAMFLSMATVINASAKDIVIQSAQGTAVIDGVKDDAYSGAVELLFDQSGMNNGGGAVLETPMAKGYVINDDEFVYVFMEVTDDELDDTSSNRYERDSVEVFYMENDAYMQNRFHIDGHADEAKSTGYIPSDDVWELVRTDAGYNFEYKFPITDVLNNSIEMNLQINACTGGKRDRTVFITGDTDGDEAASRTSRETTSGGWWNLALVGEFADTREVPAEEAEEITSRNYEEIQNMTVYGQLFAQDQVAYGWHDIGTGANIKFGETVDFAWTGLMNPVSFTAEDTDNWTKMPAFGIQVGASDWAVGDKGHCQFTFTNITVKATGYNDVVIPAGEIDGQWLAKEESWGIGGTTSQIDLRGPVTEQLGISDVEEYCSYLSALTDVTTSITFTAYNLVTPADIDAFVANLQTVEQEFIDTSLTEYTDRVNAALEAANAANGDVAALEDALKGADQATKRARTECNNQNYTGIALNYVDETLQGIVDQIQGMLDEAQTAAAAVPAEEPETAPEQTEEPAAETESSGSNTGLMVAIVVVAVVIVAVIGAIILAKKKK